MIGHSQIHRAYNRPDAVKSYFLKGGVQYTTFTGSSDLASFQAGWQVGVGMKLPIIRRYSWWLQPEFLYNNYKASLSYPAAGALPPYESTYSFTFVEMPLLLSYRANDLFELQAGPQIGVLLNNSASTTTKQAITRLTPGDLLRWNYGLCGGIEINMSPLAFGARYSYGLSKLANSETAASQLGEASLHGLQVYGAMVF
ncbi:hypothetical protein D770_17480 [Flammeovirgaceae bacterium 311]|nr:hypothetical protein D770_17480 [Flammeovirgaceae bacterium 311]